MRGPWIVRLPTWLGDTVMAVPTIRSLERVVPGRLVLWGPEANARLLAGTGIGAAILPYRRRPGVGGLADMGRGVKEIVERDPRGVLLLPNAFEPALLAFLARIPRRVGYATEGRGALLTDPMTPPDRLDTLHEADRFAGLLRPMDLPSPAPDDVRLQVPRELVRRARQRLDARRPLLGLVPGSANQPAKRWPPESFAALGQAAVDELGAAVVILGSGADREVAARVAAGIDGACLNLAGKTDVLELAAVLASCRAVVSNDTGPAHLAAALSRPTLVLYGPTDPQRTRPRGASVRIASIGAFCQPCETGVCPLDHRCMSSLNPELVATLLRPLWAEAEARG